MKMAKATSEDMDAAVQVSQIIESLERGFMPDCLDESDDGDCSRFSVDNPDQCRKVVEKLIGIGKSASLFRATFGMLVLTDPDNEIIDPAAGTLEVHPKIAKALAMHEPLLGSLKDCVAALKIAEMEHGNKFDAVINSEKLLAEAVGVKNG